MCALNVCYAHLASSLVTDLDIENKPITVYSVLFIIFILLLLIYFLSFSFYSAKLLAVIWLSTTDLEVENIIVYLYLVPFIIIYFFKF